MGWFFCLDSPFLLTNARPDGAVLSLMEARTYEESQFSLTTLCHNTHTHPTPHMIHALDPSGQVGRERRVRQCGIVQRDRDARAVTLSFCPC